ncbi:MAG: type II toxin-antitoxin system YafQ family toxin [Actinomycetota bacterium]|nr:type II toxin-antitoxin system YafQ family toxin [Actinomycetota bacterium]
MIKKAYYTRQFKKDFKHCKKRGYDMQQLINVMKLLGESKKLPVKNKDHNLKGNYSKSRECHIGPDWLLIYQLFDNDIIFVRTGSHSDLFL